MKIYERHGVIFNRTEKNGNKNISENSDFQSVMDKITASSVAKKNNISTGMQISTGNDLGILPKHDLLTSKSEVINSIKDTLDLVDFFAEKLKDSSISSDNLSPLVEELEDRLYLLKDMGESSTMDMGLKNILSNLATTMGVEIERFKRGDYL